VDALVKVVAVDGPAGSGKSTVARRVAKALGWRFVDTGATYRAITLAVLRSGADLRDPDAVVAAAQAARVGVSTDPEDLSVLLGDEDVAQEIRGEEVTGRVSSVSALPEVRLLLRDLQRRAMGVDGAVVEGRDIATVVAPRAAVKVYLDADPAVRAERRGAQVAGGTHQTRGAEGQSLRTVTQDLQRRDAQDSQTTALVASDGAVHIDTTSMTLDDVVATIIDMVRASGLYP